MRRLATSFLCLALAAAPALAAQRPIELARAEKWNVNWDDDSCSLYGVFGEGDQGIVMRMVRYQPGDGFTLQLFGKAFDRDTPYSRIGIAFGPDADLRRTPVLHGERGKKPFAITGSIWFRMQEAIPAPPALPPPVTPEEEQRITSITIDPERAPPFRLMTGPMSGPMKAMRDCTDQLVTTWGVAAAAHRSLTRRVEPVTNPGTWLRWQDYPRKALSALQLGVVQFRLIVDETGKAVSCAVQESAGGKEFVTATCNHLLQRASFRSALDAAGKPIRSFYVNRVNWVLNPP